MRTQAHPNFLMMSSESVAATLQSLPPEILSEIFIHSSTSTISVPPVLTDMPWVLGRVCRRWRDICRRERRIWGLVRVHSDLVDLHRVLELVPPAVHLDLYLAVTEERPVVSELKPLGAPVLPSLVERTEKLDMLCWDGIDGIFAESAFPLLRSLRVRCVKDASPHQSYRLFLAARHVRELCLHDGHESRKVSFVSLPFHWDNITMLDLGFNSGPSLVDFLLGLAQCTSLEHLRVSFTQNHTDTLIPKAIQRFPRLHTVQITHIVPPALANFVPQFWEHIASLNLRSVEFQDVGVLISALRQCSLLHTLSISYLCWETTETLDIPVPLPRLVNLSVEVDSTSMLFHHMIVPSLKNLHIRSDLTFNLVPLMDMLVSSECALQTIDFAFYGNFPVEQWYNSGLHDLLAASQTVTSVKIPPLHTRIAEDFAEGNLLPRLHALEWRTHYDTCGLFLSVLEKRMRLEAGGGISLCRAVCLNQSIDDLVFAESRLQFLREEYRLDVQVLSHTPEFMTWGLRINEWAKDF
ncbi:hypothetical protein DXG03_003015 [Asterophora parasitica]|uniref:F-box domain-containing protein n=1 Tax=Asterophora parasitica TaxID=117018 RepID=A0A9P7K9J2_9AGAR|nr:hypothetical protein DXG03_003015 [Asterophora parasitica]